MIDYIRTYSGEKFSTTPKADQVVLLDIATALSRIPRFGGHTTFPYSVAAHCLHVTEMVPKPLQLQALFHDASEAYIQDMPSPFKAVLPDYRKVEAKIIQAVAERFHFGLPLHPLVKQADRAALFMERQELFEVAAGPYEDGMLAVEMPVKADWNFKAWSRYSQEAIALRFMCRAERLLNP